jgi:hypothetical protein
LCNYNRAHVSKATVPANKVHQSSLNRDETIIINYMMLKSNEKVKRRTNYSIKFLHRNR